MKRAVNLPPLILCLASALFLLIGQRSADAVTITVTGSWNLTINADDLQGGAGTDLEPVYRSASDQIRLDIQAAGSWRVDVRKNDTNWHSNFVLRVRKTSGRQNPVVTVGDTDTEFFSGNGDRTPRVRVILRNVSIAIPPDTYVTTVIYTLTKR